MTKSQLAIWIAASLANILILAGLLRRHAWERMPVLWWIYVFDFAAVICENVFRLDYASWVFFDRLDMVLYAALVSTLYCLWLKGVAVWLPPICLALAILCAFQQYYGLENVRHSLYVLRVVLCVCTDYLIAWCLWFNRIDADV